MAQYTQQFLNSLLSQSGPAALPYAEGMKWHIRQHLLHLTEAYPSLQPKTACQFVGGVNADGQRYHRGLFVDTLAHSYTPPPYGSGRIMEDPAEVFKKNAIHELVESLNGDIREMRKKMEGEMEGMFGARAVLRKHDEELRIGLKEMQDEMEALEQQLQMVLMNTDILEGWLRENEGKLGSNDLNSVDADDAFELCDALSKQTLDCTASDLALEDTIYALDKAVQEGAVPFDQYIRNVRLLSREQFFHRATASKVKAVQMQAQVASMASRAQPQYAFS
ncbi:hypothetical protein DH2020_010439 [Rehmannia glutinosa]|uniref:SB domain-containing protein n=1 Tax=Rehmannia glutinosa TaxID=99300 RepID=A0ABR0XAN7_REHGL